MLRAWFPDRWVRFHSLPDSQRYAATEDEYIEILRRRRTTLAELLRDEVGPSDMIAISASWSGGVEPTPRLPELEALLPANFWQTVMLDDSDPEYQSWVHLWVSSWRLDDPATDAVFRLVADDAAQLIVLSESFTWLYAPYDGGADVIARTSAERDRLKSAHAEWLSAHPTGL
jgi:hypothetical protein